MAMSRFSLLLLCGLALVAAAAAAPMDKEATATAVKESSDAVGKSVTDSIDTITDAVNSGSKDTAGAVNDVTASVMDAVNGVTAAVTDRLAKENLPGTLTGYSVFSTLVAALTAADLVDALDGEGPFTVFAPTDDAFAAYLEQAKVSAADLLASPDLKEILEHHVIAGKYTAADVLALKLPAEVATLDGALIKIDKTTDGKLLVAGNEVVLPDIMSKNGIIHGINGVITDVTAAPKK